MPPKNRSLTPSPTNFLQVLEKLKNLKDPSGSTRLPSHFIKQPDKRKKNQPNPLDKIPNPLDLTIIEKNIQENENYDWTQFHEQILNLTRQGQRCYKPNSDDYRNIIILYHYFVSLLPVSMADNLPKIEPAVRTVARKIWESLRFTKADENSMPEDDDDDEEDYLCELFLELVDKDEYPEYYQVIQNPIDLTIIAERIELGCYDSGLIIMSKDVELMVSNCKTFNEPDSDIISTAEDLLKAYNKYLSIYPKEYLGVESASINDKNKTNLGNTKVLPGSHLPPNLGVAEENQPGGKRKRGNEIMLRDEMDITEMLLEEDETGRITYPYMPAMADIYNCVIGYTVKSEDGGFTIHEPFLTLPDKNSYPDYYKVIENPICLNMIKERLEQQYYNQNIEHLCSDFMAVFHNAKRYNEPKSNIYIYANKLESAVRRKKNDLYNKHGIKKEEYTSPKAQTPYKRRKVSGTPGSNSVQPTNNSNNTTPNAGSNPMAAKNLPQNRWKSLANHIFKSVMNIQDSNDKDRKLVDAFLKLPNKQEYPDYYKVIEKPIDIENIQFRLKHEQFTNLSEFLKAFALMCSNARQYNEPNSQIFTDASKIEAFLVTECKNQNVDQETMIKANLIKPNRPLPTRHHSLKEQMIYFLDEFLNHRDPAGKVLSYPFMTLPDRKELPDYYKTIKNPIDIEKIQDRMNKEAYSHFDDFIEDFVKMLENCCFYNEPNSTLWYDAILLMKFTVDLSRKISLSCYPEPPVVPVCQSYFLKVLEKVMASKCVKTDKHLINSLRADIQLQGLIKMPGQKQLPPKDSPAFESLDGIENNSGCLTSDQTPYPPNYYVNSGAFGPDGRPEMRRVILMLPGSIDQIHYVVRSYIQNISSPQAKQLKIKPKYPRFDILQSHVFTILRGHRLRTLPGSKLYQDCFKLQEAFIRHRDEILAEKFYSPAMSFTLEDLQREKEEEARKAEADQVSKYFNLVLPEIKGMAIVFYKAQQQSTATAKVKEINPQWQGNCPNICALVPTTDPNKYLPATFPNELEFSKTDLEFITTFGDVPNGLVIVGEKPLVIPDFVTCFGETESRSICPYNKFCEETADYPVETLYINRNSLFFAKFADIKRDVPLQKRPMAVLMPRMACLTGPKTSERMPVPQIAEDLVQPCKHDQMQFKRHYPTVELKEKPVNGIGQKEKDVADKYFEQISFPITSGLKVGDVVWLSSDKSQVISKIVRLWTRKDAPMLASGQPNYWGTGTHLMTPPQVDHQDWQSYHHKEVFRVAGNAEQNSTETVQVQFSVTGAVKSKAYLLSREEFETKRPNAHENSVFFCYRKYVDKKQAPPGSENENYPQFKIINPKNQKQSLDPTFKLVDDEVLLFNENERHKSYRFPFKKLDMISNEELKRRELEVAQTQPPTQPILPPNKNMAGPGQVPFPQQGMLQPRPMMQPGMRYPAQPRMVMPVGQRPGVPGLVPRPGMPGTPQASMNQPPTMLQPTPNLNQSISSPTSTTEKNQEKAHTAPNPWNPSGPPIRINKKGKRSAPTAYACFRHAHHPKIRADNPSMSFADINKLLNDRWKSMKEDEKKDYEEESRTTARLIKEDDEKNALNAQLNDQPLSPCPNSNQTTTTTSSTPPPPTFSGGNSQDGINQQTGYNIVFRPDGFQKPNNFDQTQSPAPNAPIQPVVQNQNPNGQMPPSMIIKQSNQPVAPNQPNQLNPQVKQIQPIPINNTNNFKPQPANRMPMGIRSGPPPAGATTGPSEPLKDYEYPEKDGYEPPKPMFINPVKSKTKLYHSRIYQNYINRMNNNLRTISDFNNPPIRPETQQEFDALPKRWLDTDKHKQYNEEGILESLDTLRDNMLRSACGLKHVLSCHYDEQAELEYRQKQAEMDSEDSGAFVLTSLN